MKDLIKTMPLYQKLGYAGILPFAFMLLALIIYATDTMHTLFFAMLLIGYSTLILSFLSAIHWPYAIKDNDKTRLILAMIPTLICFGLLYVGLRFSPLWPLPILAVLFWHQYLIDRKYFTLLEFPHGYLKFRLRVTSIVSGLILMSFVVSL